MKRTTVTIIVLAGMLAACRGTASPASVPVPRLELSALQNAQYHSVDWGDFQLTEGVFHRPPMAPAESPETYLTQLLSPVAYGDLNADGAEDAVVFLTTQNGGTGHFIELAAMINRDGTPDNASSVSLGDRVAIESARIEGGVIILELRVHGPNDGLCCPSQLETWHFRFEGDALVQAQ